VDNSNHYYRKHPQLSPRRQNTEFDSFVKMLLTQGFLEAWQRSLIGVTLVSNDRQHLDRGSNAINRLIEEIAEIQLPDIRQEWL
jgi:hypothetical protein